MIDDLMNVLSYATVVAMCVLTIAMCVVGTVLMGLMLYREFKNPSF